VQGYTTCRQSEGLRAGVHYVQTVMGGICGGTLKEFPHEYHSELFHPLSVASSSCIIFEHVETREHVYTYAHV